MSRKLEVGDFRARRDGVIVQYCGMRLYSITRPGVELWAKMYHDRPGVWYIDVYQDDQAQMRALVGSEAEAEEKASAVLLGKPTGLDWYDLSAVITDQSMRMEVKA